MSYSLLLGHDKLVCWWISKQLDAGEWLGESAGIGVIKDNKELVAGVCYYAYRWPNIEMSCASIDPRWLNRKILKAVFEYPFVTLGAKRITAVVDVDNTHAQKFDEKLGFIKEAVLKDANPNGDAIIYRMLKNECRWLKYGREVKNNQSLCA
jgi:RimJ/RimL family protein N-acetyltransferase